MPQLKKRRKIKARVKVKQRKVLMQRPSNKKKFKKQRLLLPRRNKNWQKKLSKRKKKEFRRLLRMPRKDKNKKKKISKDRLRKRLQESFYKKRMKWILRLTQAESRLPRK